MLELDGVQAQIVAHEEGPLLVTAGAGAGKTRVAVERVMRRIESGIEPSQILMLTFTRKACREMYARLRERLGGRAGMPVIETFHAFGHKLLQAAPQRCGRRGSAEEGPTLLDEAGQRGLLKDCLPPDLPLAGRDPQGPALADWLGALSWARNQGWDPHTAPDLTVAKLLREQGLPVAVAPFQALSRDYALRKAQDNVIDYDDVLLLPLQALRAHPEWAGRLAARFCDITVDEFQDTNAVQYALVQLLGMGHKNVVVVGDDDQCIYTWRGASADNLARFERDFGARRVALECNYRSRPSIVDAAARLISHNQVRLPKTPYAAEQELPGRLGHRHHADPKTMARALAGHFKARLQQGLPARQIAVLYRSHWLARDLSIALDMARVPYQVLAGHSNHDRREVQYLFAAVRLLLNPHDSSALTTLSDLVKDVGPGALATLQATATAQQLPLLLATEDLRPKARAAIESLIDSLQDLHAAGPAGLARWALAPKGLLYQQLEKLAAQSDDPSRNLASRTGLISAWQEAIDQRLQDPQESLRGWALVQDIVLQTPDAEQAEGGVTLGTIHAVKGLEYREVHVIGAQDGLLPLGPADGLLDPAHLEEERRLMYVAATRARQSLYLHTCNDLHLGPRQYPDPSPFLAEMGIALQPAAIPRRQRLGF